MLTLGHLAIVEVLEADKHLPDAVQVEQARTVKNPFN
jgi:hypothetical protein